MEAGFATIEARFDEIFANFPNRPVAWLLRFMLLPLGPRRRGPSDRLTQACAEILLVPSADARPADGGHRPRARRRALARLERAFALRVANEPLRDRLRQARVRDIDKARAQGLINDAEAGELTSRRKRLPRRLRSMILRPRNSRRGDGWSQSWETGYRKRSHDAAAE